MRFTLCVICCLSISGICPAAADAGSQAIYLDEMWRLAVSEDADFFVSISSIVVDDSGLAYIMDAKLAEVTVVDADGRLIRSFGETGEGPGDINEGSLLLLTEQQELCVVQKSPAKAQFLTLSGDFKRTVKLEAGGVDLLSVIVTKSTWSGESLVASGAVMSPAGNVTFLSRFDDAGTEIARFFEKRESVLEKPRLEDISINRLRWGAGPSGRVYTSTEYARYEIDVWDPDGRPQATIERKYKRLKRTREEQRGIEKGLGRLAESANRYRPTELNLDDYHRDIEDMYVLYDGTLLVLTSRGARRKEAGSMGVFDVYDEGGPFLSQIEIYGDAHPLHDRYFFARDRLFVVTDAHPPYNDCFQELDRDVDPVTVICYRFDPGKDFPKSQ